MNRDAKNLPDDELKNLGSSIRRTRQLRNLSQGALAAKCNFQRNYVCGVERGSRNIRFLSLLVIARALGTTVSELVDGADALGRSANKERPAS